MKTPAELGPIFQPGEMICDAEEFAAAVIRVQDRHAYLRSYLNALSKSKTGDGIQDAIDCAATLSYSGGHFINKFERALLTLINQIKRNLEFYPYWLAAPRKKKEIGGK